MGPGNGPAYIEKTADVALAVKRIMDSKTFDNGTICASEQSVMCDCDMEPAVRVEMEKQGAYFLNDEQIAKLGKFILRANGTMNPQIVGKSAQVIADLLRLRFRKEQEFWLQKRPALDLDIHIPMRSLLRFLDSILQRIMWKSVNLHRRFFITKEQDIHSPCIPKILRS